MNDQLYVNYWSLLIEAVICFHGLFLIMPILWVMLSLSLSLSLSLYFGCWNWWRSESHVALSFRPEIGREHLKTVDSSAMPISSLTSGFRIGMCNYRNHAFRKLIKVMVIPPVVSTYQSHAEQITNNCQRINYANQMSWFLVLVLVSQPFVLCLLLFIMSRNKIVPDKL